MEIPDIYISQYLDVRLTSEGPILVATEDRPYPVDWETAKVLLTVEQAQSLIAVLQQWLDQNKGGK